MNNNLSIFTFSRRILQILYCSTTFLMHANVPIVSLANILELHPEITYQRCLDKYHFEYPQFPLSINHNNHPNSGDFAEMFALTIPRGKVFSYYGWVLIDGNMIDELVWKKMYAHVHNITVIPEGNYIIINGTVAVIAQLAFFNYWHWLTEVLGRLALLDMNNISYDYVYAPQHAAFMQETLDLWGIDSSKIIDPTDATFAVQAQNVVLPSITSRTSNDPVFFACYVHPAILEYVSNKLLKAALARQPSIPLSKKIFISRKQAEIRQILNEDVFFAQLEPLGFVRYELTGMPVVDQIHLFHHADIIVAPQGTCLANSMFCKPDVHIIELYQGLNDCTFWYLAHMLNFKYTAIATTDFDPSYLPAWRNHTTMPLDVIHKIKQAIA